MADMSLTPGRMLALNMWVASLASTQVPGGEGDRASRASTGGEFGGYGWIRSGNVTLLSCGVSAGVVSAREISIRSS